METFSGEPFAQVKRVDVFEGEIDFVWHDFVWSLSGVTSYGRYVTCEETDLLSARQADLERTEATCAALIPISKSAAWWEMAQDERRTILETNSEHIKIGLEYLPAIARRLHHCREIGGDFDFLTWFEYAPEHSEAFEELVIKLRAREEWKYVVREIDIRLVRTNNNLNMQKAMRNEKSAKIKR